MWQGWKCPYCQSAPCGTGAWSRFILWKCCFYHFLPTHGTFNLATLVDTSKIKSQLLAYLSREEAWVPSVNGHSKWGNWLSHQSFHKKAAWSLKLTHSRDLPGPRRAPFKQRGDSGAEVAVLAPKPDFPPEIVLQAGQSLWKQLLQKPEQVGKAFRKERQSLEAVSALAGLETEPLPWIFFFNGSFTVVY